MSELYENIVLCQKGDKHAMEYIINKFEGLLNSAKMSFNQNRFFNNYDIEDNKQDLVMSLLNIVNRIPVENPGFRNDGCLVNYIYKSIINSKKSMYINKNIQKDFIVSKYLSNMVEFKDEYYKKDIESEIFIRDLLKVLTEKEKLIIEYEFLEGKSEREISEILKISRQSVNKTKNRALKKLKEVI